VKSLTLIIINKLNYKTMHTYNFIVDGQVYDTLITDQLGKAFDHATLLEEQLKKEVTVVRVID
jgi:hypothetical protein